MNSYDEKYKETILTEYAKAQERGCLLRCPRCGKFSMNPHMDNNAYSRIFDIYICNDCGADEAVSELENTPESITDWYAVQEPRTLTQKIYGDTPDVLKPNLIYNVEIPNHPDMLFDIRLSQDPEYPGLDVEIIEKCPSRERLSNPRVLIEWPNEHAAPRFIVWSDEQQEDPTDTIEVEK